MQQAVVWMQNWFDLFGDKMPDSEMVHLPHFLSREGVYKELRDDFCSKGMELSEIISLSRFYVVWNENFPKVSIPKVFL